MLHAASRQSFVTSSSLATGLLLEVFENFELWHGRFDRCPKISSENGRRAKKKRTPRQVKRVEERPELVKNGSWSLPEARDDTILNPEENDVVSGIQKRNGSFIQTVPETQNWLILFQVLFRSVIACFILVYRYLAMNC